MLVLNGLVGLHRTIQLQLFSVTGWGIELDYRDIEWFALETNRDHSVKEAEVERFYEDLQDLLELTPKKDVLFIIRDWNAKGGSQETPGVTG